MSAQFLRVHAYSRKKIKGVLDEADREEHAVSHIANPKKAVWFRGSRNEIELAIESYLQLPEKVRNRGKIYTRKRKHTHRCLAAGVSSWPMSINDLKMENRRSNYEIVLRWINETLKWLSIQFEANLKGACMHVDESHIHIHFFVVGDAQRIHPGLRAELVNDIRIENPRERYSAHKDGLRNWLDDYYLSVSKNFGMSRKSKSKPAWRIKDRRVRATIVELDKIIAEHKDVEMQIKRDELWDMAEKYAREEMRF